MHELNPCYPFTLNSIYLIISLRGYNFRFNSPTTENVYFRQCLCINEPSTKKTIQALAHEGVIYGL